MSTLPLFTSPVPMKGRARIFERVCSYLTKTTPQHLSVVGPRYVGKTVLLDAVAERMLTASKFECVLKWDLGHQTPQSDEEFLAVLRRKVAEGLKSTRSDLHDYLIEEEAGYEELREVINTLGKDGKRLLMLWDGFDRPLREGQLTRNLWDNLLELCREDGLTLVTSTRRKIRELIRDEKSVTSEFWLVFEVVPLGPMDEDDIRDLAASLPNLSFQTGALAELANWSGGIPPLLVGILNQIEEGAGSGAISNGHVNTAATQPDDKITDVVESLWSDVPASAADLFRLLSERKELPFQQASRDDRSALIETGLAKHVGGKLLPACRLFEQQAAGRSLDSGLLGSLFGSWNDYQANIRGILERRLAQLPRFDATLFHMVEQGIGDIPAFPEVCLNNLTHIEEKALDLIWTRELDPDQTIPQPVRNYWTESPRSNHRFVREMMDADCWEVKSERGKQLALLQLLTGSHQDFTRAKAKYATKDAYVLLNAIHSFRNRSQHAAGQAIHLGVAVSAIMLCIELLGCLSRELSD